MRGGPRALLLIISKERIDDERPHRSSFVVNSFHLLPGRPPLARPLSALPGRPLSALPGRAPRVFGLPEPIRYRLYIALTISDCYNQNMGATITVDG